jgi:hypothetical protein
MQYYANLKKYYLRKASKMPLLLLALLLCSCSPKKHTENNALPDYGEMGAASEAGRVKSE